MSHFDKSELNFVQTLNAVNFCKYSFLSIKEREKIVKLLVVREKIELNGIVFTQIHLLPYIFFTRDVSQFETSELNSEVT